MMTDKLPKARGKMARVYTRTIRGDAGLVTQYLERTKGGKAWRGWEEYEGGGRSDVYLLEMTILPLGYLPHEKGTK